MSAQRYLLSALVGLLVVIGFLLFKINSLENSTTSVTPQAINLWIIFLTGLTVGGLTCLAVQGGLLASVIAAREDEVLEKNSRFNSLFPTGAFLVSKLIVYTALGFVLGSFGGALNISSSVQTLMQLVAGIYMLAVALNLLDVHPIFRYAIIQPPRFLTRMVRNQSKSKELFAPAFLGAMTIFIPCGTTLAMEALAISSGSALTGAGILFAFVLGTMPLFFGIGWITSILGESFKKGFFRLAAVALIYLSFTSVTGALAVSGVSIGLGNSNTQPRVQAAQYNGPAQEINLSIAASGYSPTYITAKQGVPIKLNLKTTGVYSCASAFRIPSLGVAVNMQPNDAKTVEIPAQSAGALTFICSMGMYKGVINII